MQAQSITAVVLPAVRQTVDSDTPLPAIVDALADVQTAIATLEALESNLKAALIRSGQREICGANVRAVVSHIDASVTVSWQKVAKHLNAPAEVVQLYSSKKDAYDKVQLYGYN